MDEYKNYRRVSYSEMAEWYPEFDMTGVSIGEVDILNGSPKPGDMIARNPLDYNDRWLVSAEYFKHNFRPL